MSEFSEGFTVSKLIGAPAGYVGYKDRTKLSDVIKRKPYAVVLFDEIEKAHDEVLNLLLQVLEDGQLTDSTGRKINFRNAIIVMTSNAGSDKLIARDIGFNQTVEGEVTVQDATEARQAVMRELESHFRPEFLNRIDRIAVFRPLSKADLARIAGLQLRDLTQRVEKDYGVTLTVGPEAAAAIAERSWDPRYGARGVRRQIQELVENPLAKQLLAESFRAGDRVTVKAKSGEITVAKQRSHAQSHA